MTKIEVGLLLICLVFASVLLFQKGIVAVLEFTSVVSVAWLAAYILNVCIDRIVEWRKKVRVD